MGCYRRDNIWLLQDNQKLSKDNECQRPSGYYKNTSVLLQNSSLNFEIYIDLYDLKLNNQLTLFSQALIFFKIHLKWKICECDCICVCCKAIIYNTSAKRWRDELTLNFNLYDIHINYFYLCNNSIRGAVYKWEIWTSKLNCWRWHRYKWAK